MSSSKKGGPLYRITVSFTMNDDGCSVPELSITCGSSTKLEILPTTQGGLRRFGLIRGQRHVKMDELTQSQREAIYCRLRLASDGWVRSTYESAVRATRKFVRALLVGCEKSGEL
jgi:hypothetical protein